jgi:secreted Zn-dependent insulinase-like peptidase
VADREAVAIEASIERSKAVLKSKILAADPTLTKMVDVLWKEIESTAYRFERQKEQAAALRSITARDLCRFYRRYISDQKKSRRLIVEVAGGKWRKQQTPHLARVSTAGKVLSVLPLGTETSDKALQDFKRSMDFWGGNSG